MGCSDSHNEVVDHEGNRELNIGKVVMNRRCIVLICPPSF